MPMKETMALLTWPVGSKTPKPQSFLPVRSPLPKPSDAIVRFLAPDSLTALIRFIGIPQSPNPPARRKSPSLMPLTASDAVLQMVAKLKNDLFKNLLNIVFQLWNNFLNQI